MGPARTAPPLILGTLALLLLALGVGCGPSGTDAPPGGDAPAVLDATHLGWRSPECAACHDLPARGHTQTEPPTCVACHGANGACDPNGLESEREHAPTDACVVCHGRQHGFVEQAACVTCHFAAEGRDPTCGISGGGDGLLPPSWLVSACFDWPATDFSPEHFATVSPSIGTGDAAVDFTLRTPDGTPYTLSELLGTRPVLLVLGAYT